MWIARMENGDTFTKNNDDFLSLQHNKIVSLQLLYKGKFFTITRGNKTQPLLMQNISTSNLHLKSGEVTVIHKGMRIFCIKNTFGEAVGWQVSYDTDNVSFFELNLLEPKDALHHFNFRQEEIVDTGLVKMCFYEMKKEE